MVPSPGKYLKRRYITGEIWAGLLSLTDTCIYHVFLLNDPTSYSVYTFLFRCFFRNQKSTLPKEVICHRLISAIKATGLNEIYHIHSISMVLFIPVPYSVHLTGILCGCVMTLSHDDCLAELFMILPLSYMSFEIWCMLKHSKLHFLFPSESFKRNFVRLYTISPAGARRIITFVLWWCITLVSGWTCSLIAMRGNPDQGISLNPVRIRVNSIPTLETVCNCQLHMEMNWVSLHFFVY